MKNIFKPSLLALALVSVSACAGGMTNESITPSSIDMVSANRLADYAARKPPEEKYAASLWSSGPTSLFGDRRARGLGDILTVVVEIDDEAQIQNTSSANRSNSDQFTVNDLFGVPEWANGVLPGGANLNPGVDLSRTNAATGTGNISRQEEITLRLAARVVDVLPNGHMVVAGTQEILVNDENRQLQVTGIVRPEDISRQNIITYDKIAEARIAYGGKGQISRAVTSRSGSKLLDKIIPY